jgi:DNA-binding CsgD family transcriptional regulator
MKKGGDITIRKGNEVLNLSNEQFDRIIRLLEEILKWTRLEGVQRAKATLTELLKKESEKLVYEWSDGRTSREIAEIVGVSHGTVTNYWKKWARYGIVDEVRSRGGTRFKRIFPLSDLGIEVPKPDAVLTEAENKRLDP